ncbi:MULTISPECIES: SURF1 family protein [Arthrobacter]|uniref:SURF1-like protein n=2 Tax=Arthrobacter TaxID=1663 RepID=A0ABU9KGY9_9MICC|nr:SURF1 family protein [Arthrobacter sp. YJM1]MDP5225811.1 SURF1 family protein [Arthrobacter sp. YJM1]
MYRFLFSRRWLTYLGLAVIFAIACVFLGRWQMGRMEETDAVVKRISDNYNSTPVAFDQARPLFQQMDQDKEWSQVRLTGHYLAQDERVVRNRPMNSQPGYELVVPFRLDCGETVIVDRGWLPIGNKENGRPDSIPAAPAGEATVVVRIRPSEPTLNRGAPSGQIASINLPQYAQQLSYPVLQGAYGLMVSESPAPAIAPAPLPMPAVDNGTHLSYTLQWFAFGVLMLIGFGYAARQQARNDALDAEDAELAQLAADGEACDGGNLTAVASEASGEAPASHTAAKYWRQNRKKADRKQALRRASGRRNAEDEEDALLDAQGFQ